MKTTKALNAKKTEAREYQTPASGIFFTVKEVLYEGRSKFQRIEIIPCSGSRWGRACRV